MRVGGNIRRQWPGRIFADVIEGAGNVESREGTQRNLYGVHTPKYHNNEFG